MRTHKVVKFIVKVRLIEKSVKSHVGRVIVVNVINQKSRPGIMLSRSIIKRPMTVTKDAPASPVPGTAAMGC